MKESLKVREAKDAKPKRNPFTPCNRESGGGMWKQGGYECHEGTVVYRAMYNGRLERFARDCQCKIDWRNEKAMSAA